jgi:predicted DNA-binding transcriptional regulator AlpA
VKVNPMRKPAPNLTENAVSIADIASMAGWSVATVCRKMRRPELGFPRPLFSPHISRLRLFDRDEVENWLRQQEVAS